MESRTDFKPAPRVRDKALLRAMHLQGGECVLAGPDCFGKMELHHIHRHPRDDVRANLVWLCLGHHALVTVNDRTTLAALGAFLRVHRPDTFLYLHRKLGGREQARTWLERTFRL